MGIPPREFALLSCRAQAAATGGRWAAKFRWDRVAPQSRQARQARP